MSLRPISLVVIHPESLAAEGIATALGRHPGIVPLGIATSVEQGWRLGVRADAVVLHAGLPGAEACVRRLSRAGTRVIVTGGDTPGVREHVALGSALGELLAALLPDTASPEGMSALTRREREVLTLVAGGLAGKQVARHLGISPKTVERHKTRIYSKLGVPNQAAAAGIASQYDRYGEVRWTLSSI